MKRDRVASSSNQSSLSLRALRGLIAIVARQTICLPISVLGLFFLSRFLQPRDFGVQSLTALIVTGSFMVIDAGMTQALIQNSVSADLRTRRVVQVWKVVAGLLLVAITTAASATLISWYKLTDTVDALFFVVCVTVALLQSQRGHQTIRLQRDVEWSALAGIEVAEVVIQNVVAVLIAYHYRSAWAFPWGLLCRYLVGLILLNWQQRRGQGFNHSQEPGHRMSLMELLRFGVPTQIISGLSLIQNAINPIVVGSMAGLSAAGYVTWGLWIAAIPTLPFQALSLLLFSLAAESRRRRDYDGPLLACALRITLAAASVSATALVAMLPIIVTSWFGVKWLPATPATSILISANVCAWFSGLLTSQLLAFGFSAVRMRYAMFEFVALWMLAGLGGWLGGALGYAAGFALTQIMLLAGLLAAAEREVGLQMHGSYVLSCMIVNGCIAGVIGVAYSFVSNSMTNNFCLLAFLSGVGASVVHLAIFYRVLLLSDIERLWSFFKTRRALGPA